VFYGELCLLLIQSFVSGRVNFVCHYGTGLSPELLVRLVKVLMQCKSTVRRTCAVGDPGAREGGIV
jgi:hypothetical protein